MNGSFGVSGCDGSIGCDTGDMLGSVVAKLLKDNILNEVKDAFEKSY